MTCLLHPFALALLSFGLSHSAFAAPAAVSVAAASNFVHTLDALRAEFKRSAPDVVLTVTTGASGSLFAQVKSGAPFDVFLSADTDYPHAIVAAQLGPAASLRTFATGRLVFWTTAKTIEIHDISAAVRARSAQKIAIAQPRTAPYGRAAQATLETLGVWREVRSKIVYGENITQTAQFVETGNADAGFVALSLVLSPALAGKGRWQEVPPALYAPVSLDHAAVLTMRGAKNPAAQRFLDFLGTGAAKKILRDFGYVGPEWRSRNQATKAGFDR